jgi:hypothetical protein
MHQRLIYLSAAALATSTMLAGALTFAGDNTSAASGVADAASPKAVARVHLVASNSLPISAGRQDQFVLCPMGQIALGGGAVPVKADVTTPQVDATLIASYPITRQDHPVIDAAPAATDDAETADGWAGIMQVGSSGENTFLRVYAICAPRPQAR